MSYTYAQRKRTATLQADAVSSVGGMERSIPNSVRLSMLKSGEASPTASEKGRQVDMPEALRARMESSFGVDFSAVKLYESKMLENSGAEAMAQGNEIAFAPGKLDFASQFGQALLGHELSHVASQTRGQVHGSGFLADAALEARADREGAMAARGEQIYGGAVMPLSSASAAPMAGPMQARKANDEEKNDAFKKIMSDSKKSAFMTSGNRGEGYTDYGSYVTDAEKEVRQQFEESIKPHYEPVDPDEFEFSQDNIDVSEENPESQEDKWNSPEWQEKRRLARRSAMIKALSMPTYRRALNHAHSVRDDKTEETQEIIGENQTRILQAEEAKEEKDKRPQKQVDQEIDEMKKRLNREREEQIGNKVKNGWRFRSYVNKKAELNDMSDEKLTAKYTKLVEKSRKNKAKHDAKVAAFYAKRDQMEKESYDAAIRKRNFQE